MATISPTDKVFIAATGKHGKTYLAAYMMLNTRQEIWIYDPIGEPVYAKLASKNKRIKVIRPANRFPTTKEFNQICLEAIKHRHVRVVAEECHFYLKNRLNLTHYPGIMMMLYSERHWGCSLLALSRRFGACSQDLVSLCDAIFLGCMFSASDGRHAIEYLEDRDQWRKLKTIPKRTFAYFNKNARKITWVTTPEVKL